MVRTIYIGFDSKEEWSYRVCKSSIERTSPGVKVVPIIQSELRERKLYWRDKDTSSTEFSLTRYLVPHLHSGEDWALFMDCDMLVTSDLNRLFNMADPRYALMCVKHLHTPFESIKKDGYKQYVYPRKNWSSVMLFNCAHSANHDLTPEMVNSVSPAFLHRFRWLRDEEIGDLPIDFNFLVGYYKPPSGDVLPPVLHYTSGVPMVKGYKDSDYADLWLKEYEGVKNHAET